MRFGKFSFQNAGTYKKFSTDLSNLGVVFVQGRNKDTGGSNGAGKSLPWDFLEAVLFSVSSRGMKKDTLVRKGNHHISLSFINSQKNEIKVEHFRKHEKLDNGYKVYVNGEDRTPAGGIPICEKYIRSLHDLTEAEFHGFILMSQRSVRTLIEGSGPERLRYISSLFGLDAYDNIKMMSKSKLDKVAEKIKDLDASVELRKDAIKRLKALRPKAVSKRLIAKREKLFEINKDLRIHKKFLRKLQDGIVILEELKELNGDNKINISKFKQKLDDSRTTVAKLNKQIAKVTFQKKRQEQAKELKRKIKELKRKVRDTKDVSRSLYEAKLALSTAERDIVGWSSIKGDTCPTCKSKVGKKLVRKEIWRLETEIQGAKKIIQYLQSKQNKHEEQLNIQQDITTNKKLLSGIDLVEIGDELSQLKEKLNQEEIIIAKVSGKILRGRRAKELRIKLSNLGFNEKKSYKKELRTKKAKVKSLDERHNKVLSQVASLKTTMKQIKQLNVDISRYSLEIKGLGRLHRKIKLLTGVVKAYSAKGLKLEKINEIGKNLADRLSVYASPLFAEKVVKFAIPLDDAKLDFVINRRGEETDIRFLSGGEKKRLTIAFILATNSMVPPNKSSNLIILDEVDSGMDAVGKEAFRTYLLPRLKRDFESVIVISHSDAIKSSEYNQIWTAIKQKGISRMKQTVVSKGDLT